MLAWFRVPHTATFEREQHLLHWDADQRLRWLRRPITVATIVHPKPAHNSSVGIMFVEYSRLGMIGYAETVHR